MTTRGPDVLKNPRLNKGTAFTNEERDTLGLHGILPPLVSTLEQQLERGISNVRRKHNDIERYIFLAALQKRNERLYFRLLIEHIHELMPIVYTPTVGQACQEFASIFRETSGFYVSLKHRGQIKRLLNNWPERDVRLIVVTDGERILGLGDLGSNGMGIPIGKLALYCACAGIEPQQCMPVMLDVGTENEAFKEDPLYLGLRQGRTRGEPYLKFVDEFVDAVQHHFPKALLQFEDFSTPNAVTLLERHRNRLLCFNDDIQGTAAVALAGLFAATRINGLGISEMHYMFCGAGSAATGIGHLLAIALQHEGLSEAEAYARISVVDRGGLVTTARGDTRPHVAAFAKHSEEMDLQTAVATLRPHALIGATGSPGIFSKSLLATMAQHHEHPIIFALSNPTANAECTAEEAYEHTQSRAIFASGSPFRTVQRHGRIRVPGQGNNAYIFPGLGLGALHSGATKITDDMLIASAHALAKCVSQEQIDNGCLYPSLQDIREVSVHIACAVAGVAEQSGLTEESIPQNFEEKIRKAMYWPEY